MSDPEKPVNARSIPWYFDTRFVMLMLFIFGPFALPLVWLSPKFSMAWKIGTTVMAIVLTYLLGQATVALYQMLSRHLKEIQSASGM